MDPSAVDADPVEGALARLLAEHPDALVAGVDGRGHFLPLPNTIVSGRHAVTDARRALALMVPEDRVLVVAGWERAQSEGMASTSVRLAVPAATSEAMLHFYDMRARYGMMIVALVAGGLTDAVARVAISLPVAPRVSYQRKNENGHYIEIDDATTQMLGWTLDEVADQSSLTFVHPDDHDRAIETWFDMMGEPGSTRRARLRFRHHDGRWIWVEVTNHNHLDDPDLACVVAETLDIGDEMATLEALRAREQLLHRIAETIPLGLLQCDAERRVVYTNARLHEIMGPATAGSDADPFAGVRTADRELLDEMLAAAMRDGRDRDLEVRLESDASEVRRCRMSIRALSDEQGAVSGAIVCVDDITESARMRAELESRATFDALTQCLNRAAIMEELSALLTRERSVGVVFVDLDDFKRVNDDHGHAVGDAVLVEATARLRSAVRTGDLVGRLGGDEFLVICPGSRQLSEIVTVAERISYEVMRPIEVGELSVSLRASTGVAMAGDGDLDALVASADRAMYASKRQGTGQPVVAEARSGPAR